MPVWIDHSTAERIVTGLQVFFLAVAVDDGSTMIASGMEHVLVWIRAIGCMAVQTLFGNVCVLDQRRFVEVRQVALVDTHVAVELIARGYPSVGDAPFAEAVSADVDGEILIMQPSNLVMVKATI